MKNNISLSDRVRNNSEAAPWVVEAIKEFEVQNNLLRDALKENTRYMSELCRKLESDKIKLQVALSFAANVIKSGESWSTTCGDMIGKALEETK